MSLNSIAHGLPVGTPPRMFEFNRYPGVIISEIVGDRLVMLRLALVAAHKQNAHDCASSQCFSQLICFLLFCRLNRRETAFQRRNLLRRSLDLSKVLDYSP